MNFSTQKSLTSLIPCAVGIVFLLFPPALLAHGDSQEQIAAVNQEIAAHPNQPEFLLKRAELHRLHGEFGLALADCQKAEKTGPKSITTQFYRGKILFDAGLYPEARAALDRYLEVEREHSEAFLVRARVFAKLNNLERAAADFSSGIRCAPTPEPDYFLERAQVLEAAGKIETALAGLDEGIARLGPIVSLQLPAIDLEIKLKRYDAALKRIDLLAGQSQRNESWLLRRAKILERAGRVEEARRAYADAAAAIHLLPDRLGKSDPVQEIQKEVSTSLQRLAVRSP